MFEPLRHHSKSKGLRLGSRLLRSLPVSQHSWQFEYLRYPADIVFLLNLNSKIHKPPRSIFSTLFYT